jgi:hypothetical protein
MPLSNRSASKPVSTVDSEMCSRCPVNRSGVSETALLEERCRLQELITNGDILGALETDITDLADCKEKSCPPRERMGNVYLSIREILDRDARRTPKL